MMALEDSSYDSSRHDGVSSSYHVIDMNEDDELNMEDSGDGFDGRMIGHSPLDDSRENYENVDYASKLKMKTGNEKHHMVGGGGGGATFIFKVHTF